MSDSSCAPAATDNSKVFSRLMTRCEFETLFNAWERAAIIQMRNSVRHFFACFCCVTDTHVRAMLGLVRTLAMLHIANSGSFVPEILSEALEIVKSEFSV